MDGTSGLSGRRVVDEATLDDVEALAEGDPGGMLRFTASAGAQVRESASLAAEANLAVLGDEGRPRAVVIAGIGTAGRTGDVLATVDGQTCPVPVI
ncbi:mannose-6-phosphate isomerase, partial [Micromonospora zhanjiangensis]